MVAKTMAAHEAGNGSLTMVVQFPYLAFGMIYIVEHYRNIILYLVSLWEI